ncbi:hypothetical protein LEP1GSC200_3081 [Leptospira interrogans serovar Pomona str. CSL10083]|nr:hypothetical protein LEP1GSC200_3081 [Leptospira interrogans serovar Pomona str. CSL10083]
MPRFFFFLYHIFYETSGLICINSGKKFFPKHRYAAFIKTLKKLKSFLIRRSLPLNNLG